jgi:hypothetical protein
MQPDYEIVLGRGIGAILFGLSREEFTELLGDPDEVANPDEPERNSWITYSYHSIRCSFSFNPDFKGRLAGISVENDFFHIANQIRNGMSKQDLLEFAKEANLGKRGFEDMESEYLLIQEIITYDEVGLKLFLDDGVISTIKLSPYTDKEGLPLWPE